MPEHSGSSEGNRRLHQVYLADDFASRALACRELRKKRNERGDTKQRQHDRQGARPALLRVWFPYRGGPMVASSASVRCKCERQHCRQLRRKAPHLPCERVTAQIGDPSRPSMVSGDPYLLSATGKVVRRHRNASLGAEGLLHRKDGRSPLGLR